MLVAVKARPVEGGGCWVAAATAGRDGACAWRRLRGRSGRRNGSLWSNKGTMVSVRGDEGVCGGAGRSVVVSHPRRPAGDDGVDEDEQLPGAGDEGDLV